MIPDKMYDEVNDHGVVCFTGWGKQRDVAGDDETEASLLRRVKFMPYAGLNSSLPPLEPLHNGLIPFDHPGFNRLNAGIWQVRGFRRHIYTSLALCTASLGDNRIKVWKIAP